MNPQEQQAGNPQMTADESAAALAFATMLSEGMMPKMTPEEGTEAPQEAQNQPGQEKAKKQDNTDNSQDDAKFTELETRMVQMNSDMKDEISGIKDIIIEALKEDKEDGQK